MIKDVLPEWPEACDIRPLLAGQDRSISTMAAVHSVMITGDLLLPNWNIFLSLMKPTDLSHSSPRLRPSFLNLCPDLRPRLWSCLDASSPEDLSSSSDMVSLPRLFLDLKYCKHSEKYFACLAWYGHTILLS